MIDAKEETMKRDALKVLACVLTLALMAMTGCGDDTTEKGKDTGPAVDSGLTKEAGTGLEAGAGQEAGGQCQQQGERCGPGFDDCCAELICCSGVPVPVGQEYCGVTCPISDKNLKYDKRSLAPEAVLERLMTLPIATWTYNHEPPGVRHVGPMAQDFYATFGLGASDDYIAPIDANGVALVALQQIYRELQQLRCEVRSLRAENEALRAKQGKR
jgi:hypothetical protein